MAFGIHRGVNASHWLSQSDRRGPERAAYFTEDDVKLIAEMGFDHVRIPIDEEQMWDDAGRQDAEAFDLLDAALDWCGRAGLRAVVDLHILRTHHFLDGERSPLWADPHEPQRFADLWRQLSERLRGRANDQVAYELLNEPVAASDDDWNRVWPAPFAAIRQAEPQRIVVLGSNRWNSVNNFAALTVPDDEHCILTFHFYYPMLITHYTAPWWKGGGFYDGPVRYPGSPIAPEDFARLPDAERQALREDNEPFDAEAMRRLFQAPLAVRQRTAKPLYCGEFGCWDKVDAIDPAIRPAWFGDMIDLLNAEAIPWAVWDYGRGGFGILDADGKPGPVVDVLMR